MMSNALRTLSLAAIVVAVVGAGGYVVSRRVLPLAHSGPVADSVALADSARALCRGGEYNARMSCLENFLVPLVTTRGVRTAMGTLNVIGSHDEQVRADGHVYSHAIGIAAGKAGLQNIGATFASCTEIFQSGCYHGVIQAYFETVSSVDTAAVNGLCAAYTAPQSDQWLRFQCVHGMGHGLTMFYTHHLLRALKGCDLLRQGWDRESCYGGAFMENIINATAPHHPGKALHAHGAPAGHEHHAEAPFKALDSTDVQYPCSIVENRYLVACYNMQTSIMLHFNHGDMAATAQSCLEAPQAMRPVCFQSMGRDISAYSRQNHREAIRMCALAADDYEPWCHFGVVKNFIDLTAKAEDGIAYCQSVKGEPNRLKCYEAVGEEIGTLRNEPTAREAGCAPVPEAYRRACRYGARLISSLN
jgi:hypothetical protein